jgi:stage II sporulation protein D
VSAALSAAANAVTSWLATVGAMTVLRLGCAVAFAVSAIAVAPATTTATFRITGHGFGHGVGLAQWGAMGYARDTAHTYRWILRQYFPGTTRASGAGGRMRVRLKQTRAARVSLATLAVDARGRRVAISGSSVYRFEPWSGDGLEMIVSATGHVRAHLHAPVRLTGGSSLRVLGPADSGVTGGRYRDAIVLHRAGDEVLVANDIGLERYLYGVVPAEMPSAWPVEALRSQAVVARSYAVTSRRPTEPFDVYADTRSQAYRGVEGETTRTTDAVRATAGAVLKFGTSVARTLFHSSSGGRTAAVEEVFGGPPVAYLRSVEDPYDGLSPHHDWTVGLTDEEAARRLATVLAGDLVDIAVIARTPSGRAATVRVTGTLGTREVPGTTARTLLGLRSTWFTVVHEPDAARLPPRS